MIIMVVQWWKPVGLVVLAPLGFLIAYVERSVKNAVVRRRARTHGTPVIVGHTRHHRRRIDGKKR